MLRRAARVLPCLFLCSVAAASLSACSSHPTSSDSAVVCVTLEDFRIRVSRKRVPPIDDFGTGFSSLGQLRSFPVDMIKVDRSFVQGVDQETKDAAITANLVTLAHALGVLAIAEGIESDSQLASLRNLGCDLAQGYLFARPLPADDVRTVLGGGFGDVVSQRDAAA